MKRRLSLIAAAMLMAAPAQADQMETLGYVLPVVYNMHCGETLPIDFVGPMAAAVNRSPQAEVKVAFETMQKIIQKVGNEDFCRRTKPIMQDSMAKLGVAR